MLNTPEVQSYIDEKQEFYIKNFTIIGVGFVGLVTGFTIGHPFISSAVIMLFGLLALYIDAVWETEYPDNK